MRAVITAAYETPYERHPDVSVGTQGLLAQAVLGVLREAGLSLHDVDGLGVSSFTIHPDHVIDVAWKLGISPHWLMQDPLGGASGINLLQHAVRAVEAGDASVIVLVAGDCMNKQNLRSLNASYNRVTQEHLAPLGLGGPNPLFAMLTRRHMESTGLSEADYAQVALAQRRWAATNPGAAYRAPLTLEDYLTARVVSPPLRIFDCVPIVSGADAILVQADPGRTQGPRVEVTAIKAGHNPDHQVGSGLVTALAAVRDEFWEAAGIGPQDVDLVGVYDDYPVMVIEQLVDLGFVVDADLERFLNHQLKDALLPVNTSGGQLSAGQAGAAGGMHFLVEAVNQLLHRRGDGQVKDARTAVVAGYGMVLYRYGACSNAVSLRRVD
ncbi:thiolase family protein [Actinomadura sp. 9N407]|uniref:thiolase family protein n=1 Tax=Actinomadura sp. 9N407 TaxID=3375154 RepID=UPI00378FF435